YIFYYFFFFFFQAEDGIRDRNVTGVQTCALPIFPASHLAHERQTPDRSAGALRSRLVAGVVKRGPKLDERGRQLPGGRPRFCRRSEERRVGKECRSGWWT